MRRWSMSLQGDPVDLGVLAQSLTEPPVMVEVQEGGEHRLWVEQFDDLDDATTVRAEYERMVLRLAALSRLYHGVDFGDVRPGGLIGVGKDGNLTMYLGVGAATVRVRALPARIVMIDADGREIPGPPDPMVRGVQVALDDAAVDEALYFLQRPDPSWSELYKVFEIVRDAVRPATIARKGWATKDELNRLTGTANHPKLAGPEARHARMKHAPIANPMSLRDAQELVRRIVKAWISGQ